MKRLLALLLALVLLTGVACAEGLKPRRDAGGKPRREESTPSTGPAALPEAETDDFAGSAFYARRGADAGNAGFPAAPEAESPSGLKPRRGRGAPRGKACTGRT